MPRKVFALVAAVSLLIPSTAIAAPPEDAAHDYVMVLLADPPIASYEGGINGLERTKPVRGKLDPSSPAYQAYQQYLADERADYRSYLTRNAPDADVLAEYDTVLNGFAIKLNGTSTRTLANGPGARVVERSWLYQPTMNISVDVIDAAAGWTATGGSRANAGSGIKVGVIDSGIDVSHDFFDCKGDPAVKGDGIGADVYTSGDAGDTSQLLAFDHGTHVAGTIGGCVIELTSGPLTGTISGVAPGVTLHDYNVFPGYGAGFVAFGGSAFSHDIARALEDAVDDGMDIVNMSLGGSVEGPHDPLAEAVNATADAGIVPAVSAGNRGPGAETIGSPGNAVGALTAGASTNPHFIGIPFTAEPAAGGSVSGGAALGDFKAFGNVKNAAYVKAQPAEGCDALTNAGDVKGKIAIIDRGSCTFTTKVRNAQDAGAKGVLVANNVAGDPTAMGHDGTSPFPTIPAAMVSKNDGAALGASGTVSIDGRTPTEIKSDNVDILAGFSSRGPTPFTYDIKPDFTAPGVNVYSSVFENGFAMFQGTSMAAPHVAGAAALLLDQHAPGSLTPADVKSLLGNSASRTVTDHVNGTVDPGVLARGGGRIDLSTATTADVTFSPMSVSLGSHSGFGVVSESVTVTVTNLSSGPKTLTLSLPEAEPYVELSATAVEVAAGGSATFTVSLNVQGVSDTNDGDISVTDGDRTYLMPFWYSVGN